jgi:hypothetical protein
MPEGFARQMHLWKDWQLSDEQMLRVSVLAYEEEGEDSRAQFGFSLDEEGVAWLKSTCERVNPALVIIDGLRAAMVGDVSSSRDVKIFFEPLEGIARRHDAALVISHHLRKGSESLIRAGELPSLDWFRGSGNIVAPCRSVWTVDQPNLHDQAAHRLTLVKAADGAKLVTIAYRMGAPADGLEFGGEAPLPPPATKREAARRLYLERLGAEGELTHEEVVVRAKQSGIGLSDELMRQVRTELSRNGEIVQIAEGKHLRKWRLAPKGPASGEAEMLPGF